MKLSILATVLAFSASSALADPSDTRNVTITNANNETFTVHAHLAQFNESSKIATSLITFENKELKVHRRYAAVVESCGQRAGKITYIDPLNDYKIISTDLWVTEGKAVYDKVAATICLESISNALDGIAKELSKELNTPAPKAQPSTTTTQRPKYAL